MLQIQHKKGSIAGFVIGSIFIIIMIVLIIVGVMVAQQKGWFKKEEPEEQIPLIELFLKANEIKNNKKFFDANVQISYMDKGHEVIAYDGKLNADAYTPFIVPKDRNIIVRCWDDKHYLVKAVKVHNSRELQANKSVMDCTTARIGDLEIKKISGDLGHSFNSIKLNITARDGWWYRMGICFEWTAGIISVTSQNQWIICRAGKWLNYSVYYPENKTYIWLPNDEYRCGKDFENTERCIATHINKCKLPDAKIPFRFSGKVDSCTYTGETLEPDESIIIQLDIPTIENKNSLDYVALHFYDHDRRWDKKEQRWIWNSAVGTTNLGAEDQEYTIWYKK